MQFDHYKLHLTFADGTTETLCNERLHPLTTDGTELMRQVRAEGGDVALMKLYKVFGSDTETGPYELLILED